MTSWVRLHPKIDLRIFAGNERRGELNLAIPLVPSRSWAVGFRQAAERPSLTNSGGATEGNTVRCTRLSIEATCSHSGRACEPGKLLACAEGRTGLS